MDNSRREQDSFAAKTPIARRAALRVLGAGGLAFLGAIGVSRSAQGRIRIKNDNKNNNHNKKNKHEKNNNG